MYQERAEIEMPTCTALTGRKYQDSALYQLYPQENETSARKQYCIKRYHITLKQILSAKLIISRKYQKSTTRSAERKKEKELTAKQL